ncbi:MAG: class I SAM-dependent methyltransferase [Anaerolineaceae bacterium]|nr:class I SAM-dependent methyltransferase [Anaerolineaceae bacterium]
MTPAQDSYDEKFFEPLIAIEEKHFWFRSRNYLISQLIQRYCTGKSEESVRGMEIGCGTGNVLKYLQSKFSKQNIIGVDLFREGLQFAAERGAENLIQADINMAPFAPGYSWIGLFDIIEHLDDDIAVLQRISGLLLEEGYLFLSVPAFPALWSYFDVAGKHKRRYTVETLQNSLSSAGMELVFASYTNVLIFPILWVVRRLFQSANAPEMLTEKQLDSKTNAELRIIPVVNGLLTVILQIEGKLIQSGIRMPFGTSLIGVAKRKNLIGDL